MVTISQDQWEKLNQKLDGWVIAIFAFLAKELWDAFKGRGKKLGEIESNVSKILSRMDDFATKEKAREIARDELLHARDLQR